MENNSQSTSGVKLKLEVVQVLINKGYTIHEAAEAMDVRVSVIKHWLNQLKPNED